MKARNLVLAAMSATLLVGGVACSKSKSKKHPAVNPVTPAEEKITSTDADCSNFEGNWAFRGDSVGSIEGFYFGRDLDNNLIWLTKDLATHVVLDGQDQKAMDREAKSERLVNGTCVADEGGDYLVMDIKDDKGNKVTYEWRASVEEAMGNVTEIMGDKKKIYVFDRVFAPAMNEAKAETPAAAEVPVQVQEGLE